MARRNRHTVVSVHFAPWYEDAYTGYAEKPVAQRVHGPLKQLKSVTLVSGGLLLGRYTADSPNHGWQSFDFADSQDDLVSRVGFQIREDLENGYTHVRVHQVCTRQRWGQSSSVKLADTELPAVETVRTQPTSYRVDGRRGSYWILIEPGIKTPVVRPHRDNSGTGAAKVTKTGQGLEPGSELHTEFVGLLPVLQVYFGQYLEWPPRVSPKRDRKLAVRGVDDSPLPVVEDSGIAALKNFDVKLSYLVGYTKWDKAGAPPAMIEWLTTSGDDMPFHEYKKPSKIGQRRR